MSRLTKHPLLYEPFQVGPVKLKNRLVTPPMLPCFATAEGVITTEAIAFAGRLAKCGAGLVIMGETSIDSDRSYDHLGAINLGTDKVIPKLSMMADEVHRYGGKISIELNHSGACAELLLFDEGKVGVSPSPLPDYIHPGYVGKPVEILTRPMMDKIVENYVKAVERCVLAHFDMVTIHCAHGWLLGQFLSPSFNTRTDEYGGSLENRMRFPLEVIKAVSERFKGQIGIDMRVAGCARVPEFISPDENNFENIAAFVKAAEPYIDMVNVSAGFIPFLPSLEYMIQSYFLPHMTNVEFAEKLKKVVNIPVCIAGSITTLDEADAVLAEGKADLVAMGRAGLADTDLFVKGAQGRDDEIRPCLRCTFCSSQIEPPAFKSIRCAVNPMVGRETEYPRVPAAIKKQKVMIIGGGPAGMEACQRLTQRGHEVVLYEASDRLGGMLHTASALPFKGDMRRYMQWMADQCHKCGATIHLNTKATPETIEAENPDVVLVAIGAVPVCPKIPTASGKEMVWAGDVDTGKATVGDNVLIVGAGLTGTETAIGLAEEGKKVTVIDMIPADKFLLGTAGPVILSLNHKIMDHNIEFIFNASISEITEEGAVYIDANGEKHTFACDSVVNAVGMRVENDKVEDLLSVVPKSYVIGDCANKKMTIPNAILDAFTISMDI